MIYPVKHRSNGVLLNCTIHAALLKNQYLFTLQLNTSAPCENNLKKIKRENKQAYLMYEKKTTFDNVFSVHININTQSD